MRLIIILLIINSFFIYFNQKVDNETTNDNEEDDKDLIEQLINNLDNFFSDLIEQLDIENEIIIKEEDLDIDNFNIGDFLSENEYELEDFDDEESIWPERPIPRYKNIV